MFLIYLYSGKSYGKDSDASNGAEISSGDAAFSSKVMATFTSDGNRVGSV